MATRDTSGLWKTQATAPDRATGIAPPPRAKREPAQVAPTPPAAESPATTPTPVEPSPPPATPQAPVPTKPAKEGDTKLLALSFTSDQMDWIRKTSSRRGLWAGELFEDLFSSHKDQIASTGVGRRTRRRNANYTGTRVVVPIAFYDDFAALAAELGTSKAALGRVIIDTERD